MTSAGEEAAVIAQEFITSLDNVPSEVQFLLAEMRERECRINELQARIQPRSAQYIRHASKGVISEKDSQTLERIQADFKLISTLADEKVLMAKKLRDLLTKHSNRLKVELGRITNPNAVEFTGRPSLPATTSTAVAVSVVGTSTATQPDTLVYSGASRTPITNVVAALKSETTVTAAPAVVAVPVVVEPPSAAASNASSPASAAPNKRRRLLSSQSNTSAQPAATPAPSTPAPTSRSSVPRSSAANNTLAAAAAATTTTASSRTRRAASATAANATPAADPPPATRKMSESTSISTSTTGGEKEDEDMADPDSSAGEGGDDQDDPEGDPDDGPYCVCQEKSYGEMIGCDNGADCPYQWFHVACVHVQKPLPATWFCDYCTKKLGYADNTGATAAPQQSSSSERAARKKRGR